MSHAYTHRTRGVKNRLFCCSSHWKYTYKLFRCLVLWLQWICFCKLDTCIVYTFRDIPIVVGKHTNRLNVTHVWIEMYRCIFREQRQFRFVADKMKNGIKTTTEKSLNCHCHLYIFLACQICVRHANRWMRERRKNNRNNIFVSDDRKMHRHRHGADR